MAGHLPGARWWGGSPRVCSTSTVMGQDPPPALTPTRFQPPAQYSHRSASRTPHSARAFLRSPHPLDQVRTCTAQGPSWQDTCWSLCLQDSTCSASGSWPECLPSLQQGDGSSPSWGPGLCHWPFLFVSKTGLTLDDVTGQSNPRLVAVHPFIHLLTCPFHTARTGPDGESWWGAGVRGSWRI